MDCKRKSSAAVMLLCFFVVSRRSPATIYVLVDLGGGSSTSSDRRGLNSDGQCVGFFSTGSDDRAFRTSSIGPINNQSCDLGTFGCSYPQSFCVQAIGQAVGLSGWNGNSA